MSNALLGPTGIAGRTETHRSQLMTLWVTRQNQQFLTGNDLQLCDVRLLNATAELVGERGNWNQGDTTIDYKATVNTLQVNRADVTSTVYGEPLGNSIHTRSELNHGHINISIEGMMETHQFKQDPSQVGNQLHLVVPTDLGLINNRIINWPPTPLLLERVKLEQRLTVHSEFLGLGPPNKRIGRFVQDWADSFEAGVIKRNEDGSVRYFLGDNELIPDPVPAEDDPVQLLHQCQVPSNCIEAIKLVFEIQPRTIL